MSSSWLTRALLVVGMAATLLIATGERAYAMDTYVIPEDKDLSVKVATKLSRGIINVGTSVLEIPKKAYIESSRSDQWIETLGRLSAGVLIGAGRTVIRAGAGAFDIITFPFDINDYEPILEPEYVF
ncbi:MAG: exosortase system-associated protein, TIGR04073 family [Deltaproteobacteria bacterium]|nr:exosortase system-associated protein, TIGR04073 family [Deltaproteobacteria bacterium]